jgi:hypothetical protein
VVADKYPPVLKNANFLKFLQYYSRGGSRRVQFHPGDENGRVKWCSFVATLEPFSGFLRSLLRENVPSAHNINKISAQTSHIKCYLALYFATRGGGGFLQLFSGAGEESRWRRGREMRKEVGLNRTSYTHICSAPRFSSPRVSLCGVYYATAPTTEKERYAASKTSNIHTRRIK